MHYPLTPIVWHKHLNSVTDYNFEVAWPCSLSFRIAWPILPMHVPMPMHAFFVVWHLCMHDAYLTYI